MKKELKISIPEAFLHAGRCCHADVPFECKTEEDFVNYFTNTIHNVEKTNVKNFMIKIVSENYSDNDLLTIWRRTGSDTHFRSGAWLRFFFKAVIDRLP